MCYVYIKLLNYINYKNLYVIIMYNVELYMYKFVRDVQICVVMYEVNCN